MAIQLKINAQARTAAGRNAVKKIKQAGFVPAVIYGAKDAAQNLQIVERELATLLDHASSESVLVEVSVDGQTRTALIQEVQHHPISRKILHVDLHAVAMDELLTAEVPIETTGEAVGVRTGGGVLEQSLRTLEIECLPADLPTAVLVDVSNLEVGASLHVRDIILPKGVTALNDADLTVVAVAEPTVSEATDTVAATAVAAPAGAAEKKPEEGAAPAAAPASK
jgi:large subunit ribosomal protein L25